MNNMDYLKYCINYLTKVNHINSLIMKEDFYTFRGLMNITMPYNLSDEYYAYQDIVIKEELSKKNIIDVDSLEYKNHLAIFKGDITTLKADAIVNACNSELLGCFSPNHSCIDNAIHSYAGLQVRRDLMEIMEKQGHEEENGKCKVTKGYCLFSKYIFHTVGPIVYDKLTLKNKEDLKSCYTSCLKTADEMGLKSIVFCCISTGVYGFPKLEACKIAINTCKEYLLNHKDTSIDKIIFNVFGMEDYEYYTSNID